MHRQGIEAKRSLLESLQKRCSASQSKLEVEYSHLGSLEAKTKELENIRKVQSQRCHDHLCPLSLYFCCEDCASVA